MMVPHSHLQPQHQHDGAEQQRSNAIIEEALALHALPHALYDIGCLLELTGRLCLPLDSALQGPPLRVEHAQHCGADPRRFSELLSKGMDIRSKVIGQLGEVTTRDTRQASAHAFLSFRVKREQWLIQLGTHIVWGCEYCDNAAG